MDTGTGVVSSLTITQLHKCMAVMKTTDYHISEIFIWYVVDLRSCGTGHEKPTICPWNKKNTTISLQLPCRISVFAV